MKTEDDPHELHKTMRYQMHSFPVKFSYAEVNYMIERIQEFRDERMARQVLNKLRRLLD